MKTKKTLFFDFDGTIVDSKKAYYDAVGDVLKDFGFKFKDVDKAIDMGFSLKRTLRKLGFSWVMTLLLKKRIMTKVKGHVDEVKKCKDIDSIKKLDGKKILVTNSSKEFLKPIFRHLKIKKYFSEIYGAEDFDDKGKFLKDYIKKKKLDKEDCYYIGDRVKDVEVARDVGCKSVIIESKCAWDTQKELEKAKPDFIVKGFRQLGGILKN